jgi:hypothetical protein
MYLFVVDTIWSDRSALLSRKNNTKKVYSPKPFEWDEIVVNDFHIG